MSKPWRFYHASTGVFVPGSMLLPNQAAVAANTPAEHVATQIDADPFTQRFDVDTGTLVPYTRERDRRMAESDWVTLRALRTGQPIPSDWAAYMQALADLPQQPGFPESITWPTPPTS
jgi:hypothetical protein